MTALTNRQFGALGEQTAVEYLKKQHHKILNRNYKTKLGEIDIIARNGGEIVFIEVKTRSADPYVSGQYAVDSRKQFHILRTAAQYLKDTRCRLQPRFDILEVEINRATGETVRINHFKNAFAQTEDYARL